MKTKNYLCKEQLQSVLTMLPMDQRLATKIRECVAAAIKEIDMADGKAFGTTKEPPVNPMIVAASQTKQPVQSINLIDKWIAEEKQKLVKPTSPVNTDIDNLFG